MPHLVTETVVTGDHTWLGSTHGIENCRTAELDISKFSDVTHFPDGYIPSGTALGFNNDGSLGPYTVAEGTETNLGILAGFLFTDQSVTDPSIKIPVPLFYHGTVVEAKVPGTFTAPVKATKRAKTKIVFV